MTAENLLAPRAVDVEIAGKTYPLSYPLHAVVVYQRETARIERSRPRPADPDPRCLCGFRKSAHVGPTLIRVTADQELLCVRFREDDPLAGDSLFLFDTWRKIDLSLDPERFLACLWAGLHQEKDGRWRAPFTLDELSGKLGICIDTRKVQDQIFEALAAWMPKAEKSPNAAAPAPSGEPALTTVPTSENSSRDSETATA
jgi:hypothetical protein